MDEEKVKVIQDWPIPKSVSEVRSFYKLASFYRRFMKDFITLPTPLNEVVKKSVRFKCGEEQELTFAFLKEKLLDDALPVLEKQNQSKIKNQPGLRSII